jgi:hypothetical protein
MTAFNGDLKMKATNNESAKAIATEVMLYLGAFGLAGVIAIIILILSLMSS